MKLAPMFPHRIARRFVTASMAAVILGIAIAGFPNPARGQGDELRIARPSLKLREGDHVAIVGGAIADRMQHSGHLETLIHARFPELQLVLRNLSAAGDEVSVRARSENFGSPDDWLRKTQADVILGFFGYNESFQGPAGIEKFKDDLRKYVRSAQGNNFSGRGAPRLALVSSPAQEKHQDPNYPDPTPNNENLRLYARAMGEVAAELNLPFVDLFSASQPIFAAAAARAESLTVNGHLLTDAGDRAMAPVIFQSLFGEKAPSGDFENLRSAVNEKNWQWHQRYRTVDGYNVYGGRSALAYQPDKGGFISDRSAPEPHVSNYKIMQQEMSQRDVLTANRDRRVWALAKGSDIVVDDSNLPRVEPVKSNKPGGNDDKSHKYLTGEEAISRMTVHSGMKVNLFASEEQFPDLINPVQMAWDTRGRLWIAAWPNYPERTPESKKGDSLIVLEDTNGDGKADKSTEFIGDLNAPTGFQFYKDGVLVVQAPDIWFVRDTNGDGKADWKERILMGLDSADSHHTANAVCLDPGGAIYLSDGVFHRTQIETAEGPVRNLDAAIFRFEPGTGRFQTYIAYGFANPHGRVFDYWGNDIVTDATGNANYFGPAFSGYLDYPAKHPGMREFWNRPSRPCPGTGILTSRHFPDEFQGNFLNLNVISFQGIFRVKVTDENSGLKGETLENLISSTDPNFRPAAISVGPDGAIYFTDWHQAIIGHMQHHLRDPNRGHNHGRVYRVTYDGRPLVKQPAIHGQPIPALLDLLKEPENQVRELAKVELGARPTADVIRSTKAWSTGLAKNDPAYEHHLMESLWVHQWHNVVDEPLLRRMLESPEPRARAAAGRVLCYWRDRVPEAQNLFRRMAEDTHPRVRLEAVRGASFFRNPEAVDVALAALNHPMDYYIEYTMKESVRQLEQFWRKSIASGKLPVQNNPKGTAYLLNSVPTQDLLKLPRTADTLQTILSRPGLTDNDRNVALNDLATAQKTDRVTQLASLIEAQSGNTAAGAGLARLFPLQVPSELAAQRSRLQKIADQGGSPSIRAATWAGLALADNSFDRVWKDASSSPSKLNDLISGIPLILDSDFRDKAYDKVRPLISKLPAEWESDPDARKAVGRFVRVELPRRGTLTLAEVEVISDGKNVARGGKARQSSTSNGGEASRAIDGRRDGSYSSDTQTHSQENEQNPWWEVDLGGSYPIQNVNVWNRTESSLGARLDGFLLTILDASRNPVFKSQPVPAPASNASIAVSSDAGRSLRRSAIRAAVTMNNDPKSVFSDLSALIRNGDMVVPAAQGLRSLPRTSWPQDQAASAASGLVAWARNIPSADRTGRDFVEITQLAGDLSGYLPAASAASLNSELKALRVNSFVIRTVQEQMRFDTPRIVVQTGKPAEIIFENSDFMPHNLVIVPPGARENIGTAAAAMGPTELDNQGRAYVPRRMGVIGATKLLEAGQQETLRFDAPANEGIHEFVCTFPGHHQVMWGQLVVTRDVDEYLLRNPKPPATVDHPHDK